MVAVSLKNTVNGPHSIFSDTKNAIMTIKDDPGNHKKKALAGVAGALAGAYVAAKNMTLGGHAEKLDKALEVDSSKASKLNQVIADVSQWLLPASVYYTSRNLDRDSRAIAGTAATVGAHKINQMAFKNSVMKNQNINIPPEAVAPMMRANAGMATAAGSTIYALHRFCLHIRAIQFLPQDSAECLTVSDLVLSFTEAVQQAVQTSSH